MPHMLYTSSPPTTRDDALRGHGDPAPPLLAAAAGFSDLPALPGLTAPLPDASSLFESAGLAAAGAGAAEPASPSSLLEPQSSSGAAASPASSCALAASGAANGRISLSAGM